MLTQIILAALLTGQQGTPEALLEATKNHYAAQPSLRMTLVHLNSSGLFPGSYEQELRWAKRNHFTLRVTKRVDQKAREGDSGTEAPDYEATPLDVLVRWPDGRRSKDAILPPEGYEPGWLVSGGPILKWLERLDGNRPVDARVTTVGEGSASSKVSSPMSKRTYAWGPLKRWQGEVVRAVITTITRGKETVTIFQYFHIEKPILVGMEYRAGAQTGSVQYKDQGPIGA